MGHLLLNSDVGWGKKGELGITNATILPACLDIQTCAQSLFVPRQRIFKIMPE